MKRIDCMSVSQFRGVYTTRDYYNGRENRYYTVTTSSKMRIESLVNSGLYKVNTQIRNFHGLPAPIIFISRKESI